MTRSLVMPLSIRVRITVVASLLFALVLTGLAIAVVAVQRHELLVNLDRALEQRADQLLAEMHREQDEGVSGVVMLPGTNREDRFAQVVASDGTVLAATQNLAGAPALPLPLTVDEQQYRDADDLPVEDDTFRVLIRPVYVSDRSAVLYVGENIDDLRDVVRALTITMSIGVPVLVVLLGATVWVLVGRTLRPVEAIRREVAEIGADQLDRRVPEPTTGDEVARLAATMNELLARLEEATIRQRRIVADVSHELRSPVARMRTALEVAAATDGSLDAEGFGALLGDVRELHQLLDDLLRLARFDEGTTTPRRELVDLDDIVFAEASRSRDGGCRIHLDDVSAALVRGDADELTMVVRNLLDNACRHAVSGVQVGLTEWVGEAGARFVSLVVCDDGPGVPVDSRVRVFERFTRLDDARSRHDGGSGLGLAIVREVVVRHDGSVAVDEAPSGGARFTVTLPGV